MASLKQCKCSKTISKFNGDLEKGLCFACLAKQTSEGTRKRQLSDYVKNVKKKVTKPKQINPSIIKIAKLEE